MNPTLLKVIVVIATVVIVEAAKKYIFHGDEKFKLLYTFAPVVLCTIAFGIIALIQKTDVWAGLSIGAALGLTTMGSYDAIKAVLKGWKNKTPAEIAEEIEEIIEKKEIKK